MGIDSLRRIAGRASNGLKGLRSRMTKFRLGNSMSTLDALLDEAMKDSAIKQLSSEGKYSQKLKKIIREYEKEKTDYKTGKKKREEEIKKCRNLSRVKPLVRDYKLFIKKHKEKRKNIAKQLMDGVLSPLNSFVLRFLGAMPKDMNPNKFDAWKLEEIKEGNKALTDQVPNYYRYFSLRNTLETMTKGIDPFIKNKNFIILATVKQYDAQELDDDELKELTIGLPEVKHGAKI